MYGLSVLLWGVDDQSNNGLYKMLRNRYIYGGLGHAAIKLTIPFTEENTRFVNAYCYCDAGLPLFPVVKTSIKVTAKDGNNYIAKEEPCYEIYFSWMPKGINSEIEDRLCQIDSSERSYSAKGKQLLFPNESTPKMSAPLRYIGSWLEFLAHPFASNSHEVDRMPHSIGKASEFDETLIERFNQCSKAINESFDLVKTLTDPFLDFSQSEETMNEEALLSVYSQYRKQLKQYHAVGSAMSQKASYGSNPQHEIHIPIQREGRVGLNVGKILKEMQVFCSQYEFNLAWLNCSHAARYLLLSGIDKELHSRLSEHMRQWDLLPSSYDNPTRINDFAMKLQSALLQINQLAYTNKNNDNANDHRKISPKL